MYPLKRQKYKRWTIGQAHVIGAIWLLGLAISMPEYLMFRLHPFCHNRRLYFECRSDWPSSTSDKYTVFIFMATFLLPWSLLAYLYTSIGLKVWRRQCPGNLDATRDQTMQTNRVKCVKMLLVVVVLFAVFWLPLQTFSMVIFLNPAIREGFVYKSIGYNIFIVTYFACHWLGMAHSCLNPLIYCFMSDNFRADLDALFCGLVGRAERAGVPFFASNNSTSNYNNKWTNQEASAGSKHHLQAAALTQVASNCEPGAARRAPSLRLKFVAAAPDSTKRMPVVTEMDYRRTTSWAGPSGGRQPEGAAAHRFVRTVASGAAFYSCTSEQSTSV